MGSYVALDLGATSGRVRVACPRDGRLDLGNRGMFPLGGSDARALQVTEMADRTTRVLATALSLGTVVPTAERSAVRIDTRDDEQTDAARPDSRGGP